MKKITKTANVLKPITTYKSVAEQISVWVTDDGTVYKTEAEAADHEFRQTRERISLPDPVINDTLDEVIAKLTDLKKKYGGDATLNINDDGDFYIMAKKK